VFQPDVGVPTFRLSGLFQGNIREALELVHYVFIAVIPPCGGTHVALCGTQLNGFNAFPFQLEQPFLLCPFRSRLQRQSGKHKCQYDKYRCETLFHMSHHVALSAKKPDVKAPFCARAFPFFLLFTLNRHAALSVQKSNKKTACCMCRFLSFIFHTIPPAESPSLLPLHSVLQLLYRQN